MKFRYLLILLFCIFFSSITYAQFIAPNVFLQGAYVEVGVALNGSFGAGPTPAGYHPRTSGGAPGPIGTNVSMVYDYGHDGWAVGTPGFWGDYTYPGTPFEGWAMQVDGARGDAFYTVGGGAGGSFWNAPGGTLTGTNTAFSAVPQSLPCGATGYGRAMTGVWTGTAGLGGALQIRQTTVVDTGASWVYVNTVFKNTSAAVMPGLYYWRTCDPDNSVTQAGGSYGTNNSITWQNDADHRVLSGSYGNPATYNAAYLALGTKDCRAKTFIYTAWASYPAEVPGNNLDLIYNGTATALGTTYYVPQTVTNAQDIAIGLIYNLGNLAAGDSSMISYAYIFKDSVCIDSVFPEPQLVVNCVPQVPSGPAPAPTFDTFNMCDFPAMTSLPVSVVNGSSKNWSWSKWSWAPSLGLATTTGITNSIDLNSITSLTTYTITGTDSAYGMNTCAHRVFYLTLLPPCVRATNNGPICAGDTLELNSPGDSVGATYYWFGPGGYTAFGQAATRNPTTALDSGWYYVVKVVGSTHDTGRTHVVVKRLPVINLSSNAPICSGNTLTLTAAPDSVGEIWSWTGPAGFTAGIANPIRINAHTNYSGTYKVWANLRGCIDSNFINVVVDSTPVAPVVSSNSPICSQTPLLLSSSSATAGVTYSWTGPAGFTSALQNPSIASANTSASGAYVLTVSLGVCTNSATLTAAVDSTPHQPILGSNSPVCTGNPLNLTATSTAGANYSWVGPAGFASLAQNPTINPALTMNTGTYTVTASQTYTVGATVHTCTSLPATINVVVDTTPVAPTAYSNSPGAPGVAICEGDTLRLFANHITPGVTYLWSGPNAFTSTQQNPIILNVGTAAAGLYQVTAFIGGCSSSVIISVFIKPTPPVSATSNTPVCSGDSLKLFATTLPGGTFSWIGPYTFITNVQNPVRVPAVSEQSGVYTVTVVVNGCKNSARDTVQVNQTPNPPMVNWPVYCQYYDSQELMPIGTNLLWYTSSTPGLPGSPIPPVPPTNIPSIQWYYVSQTITGCTSKIDSIMVTVNPKPTVTARNPLMVCPRDTVSLMAFSPDASINFRWSPKKYLEDPTKAITLSHPETNTHYMVIATNQYDCMDTAFADVSVRPNAVIYLGDSVMLYPGESYQIKPQTNCTYFTWFPAGGLDNPYVSNPVAHPTADTRYIVMAETEWGCSIQDTLMIYISDESLLALPNAFIPGNGPNSLFKILKRGDAVLNHFRIYDRWGIVVFETTDISKGWDGTYKGVPQPFGVYVYQVSAVTSIGTPFTKVGNVTLIR